MLTLDEVVLEEDLAPGLAAELGECRRGIGRRDVEGFGGGERGAPRTERHRRSESGSDSA
jgi:hypothetical protein